MHWPVPLPPTVGYNLDHLNTDILECFDNVTAIASDGHDAMNDPANQAYTWKITSMSPPAGTLVPMDQQIKLTVVRDDNAPS
ncbi:PASTA domain-containing protein [Mycobacterium sherrisii]|uniref:PASTA domain-containing protein n=1 Tax=Mycobacterium sherrisii TaxID=243061 RepID=UPI002DDD54C2|nr:PASTA domain-containing protein [Mycobacterium sherrisii]MEC4764771.1 PASTA domain-containing protein [Mycobacterium sherrisii]